MASSGMLLGSEFLGRTADNEGVSGYLATRSIRFMWSICQHEQSSEFDTRSIVLSNLSAFVHKLDSISNGVLQKGSFPKKDIYMPNYMEYLEAFKEDSHSPLYLPFVISVYVLEECWERICSVNMLVMR